MYTSPRLSASASRSALRLPSAHWKTAVTSGRLEPECWPTIQPKFQIAHSDVVFTIGSCFARNIEAYLARLKMSVPMSTFDWSNGAGTHIGPGSLNKYTPCDILQEIDRTSRLISAAEEAREAILLEPLMELPDGRFIDLDCLAAGPMTRDEALGLRRRLFDVFSWAFRGDVVIITPGHIECWWDQVTGLSVQGRPATPQWPEFADRFYTQRLTIAQAYDALDCTIQALNVHGEQKILLTTSPVPLKATFSGEDIITANMFSKATLRAVVGELSAKYANVGYFPSFESAILSHAAGVWEADRRHVSDGFVGKIVQRFMGAYFTDFAEQVDSADQAWIHLRLAQPSLALAELERRPPADVDLGGTLRGLAQLASGSMSGADLLEAHALQVDCPADIRLAAAVELFVCGRTKAAKTVAARALKGEMEKAAMRRTFRIIIEVADISTATGFDRAAARWTGDAALKDMPAILAAMTGWRLGRRKHAAKLLEFDRKSNRTMFAGQALHARLLCVQALIQRDAGNADAARSLLEDAARSAPEDAGIASHLELFDTTPQVEEAAVPKRLFLGFDLSPVLSKVFPR